MMKKTLLCLLILCVTCIALGACDFTAKDTSTYIGEGKEYYDTVVTVTKVEQSDLTDGKYDIRVYFKVKNNADSTLGRFDEDNFDLQYKDETNKFEPKGEVDVVITGGAETSHCLDFSVPTSLTEKDCYFVLDWGALYFEEKIMLKYRDASKTIDTAVDNNCYIGETFTTKNNIQYTVTNVSDYKSLPGKSYTTEANFIVVQLTIKNGSDNVFSENPNDCTLQAGSATYQYSSATYSYSDGMTSLVSFNPGLSKSFVIIYETPTTHTSTIYRFRVETKSTLLSYDYFDIILTVRK